MKATSARGTEATCASQIGRWESVAPRNVMVTPVATHTTARLKMARPAHLARRFHVRIMRFACVAANTKKGTAMSTPSVRCRSSIA